jgi:hypothetical protein
VSAALTTVEPLKISGSHASREERGQKLANLFIGEMVPLLVQVRQDFLDKGRDETICGVNTFTEYCTSILRYSESHIRRLIKGQNPASEKHDGSANREAIVVESKESKPTKSNTEEALNCINSIVGPTSFMDTARVYLDVMLELEHRLNEMQNTLGEQGSV